MFQYIVELVKIGVKKRCSETRYINNYLIHGENERGRICLESGKLDYAVN